MHLTQSTQKAGRMLYALEILVFALPFYLTYGMLAFIAVPYAGLLIMVSPVWISAYLLDANGEIEPVLLVSFMVIFAAALSVSGSVALWKLGKLSRIYLFKGPEELSRHRKDFVKGFMWGLAPLVFTTICMGAIAVSDVGWQGLPFAAIGGGTLLIPVTHLWIAIRRQRNEALAGEASLTPS
ncbi:hypothetical protein G6L28_00980 [Agrobacterium larrymoorei]|uniref:hypothetical protein n=1 Tax=Agrobacterium larrymoorei TaxID=160699 RepID=UPI00157381A4|nr:hypothetical protein [Agrobacterium larrymoorei]NTJ41172.1 hypothetical protein [Agrobacterium larrymoorei]